MNGHDSQLGLVEEEEGIKDTKSVKSCLRRSLKYQIGDKMITLSTSGKKFQQKILLGFYNKKFNMSWHFFYIKNQSTWTS